MMQSTLDGDVLHIGDPETVPLSRLAEVVLKLSSLVRAQEQDLHRQQSRITQLENEVRILRDQGGQRQIGTYATPPVNGTPHQSLLDATPRVDRKEALRKSREQQAEVERIRKEKKEAQRLAQERADEELTARKREKAEELRLETQKRAAQRAVAARIEYLAEAEQQRNLRQVEQERVRKEAEELYRKDDQQKQLTEKRRNLMSKLLTGDEEVASDAHTPGDNIFGNGHRSHALRTGRSLFDGPGERAPSDSRDGLPKNNAPSVVRSADEEVDESV